MYEDITYSMMSLHSLTVQISLHSMRYIHSLTLPFLILLMASSCSKTTQTDHSSTSDTLSFGVPETYMDHSVVDTFFGKTVADPYRWLEDENSAETKAWVKEQNKATFAHLEEIPFRNQIKERVGELWNFERYSSPFKEAGVYYFFKNDGVQNQSVLFKQTTLDSTSSPELVLDPNKWSEKGTTSLRGFAVNKDGTYAAYGKAEGGSDWFSIYVKDLKTGKDLKDEIKWAKFTGINWYKDGFFYSRYPEPTDDEKLSQLNEFHQLYYHKIGTSQNDDILIMNDRANPNRNFYGSTTDDEDYLFVYISESTSGNSLLMKKLDDNFATSPFVTIAEGFEKDHSVIGVVNDKVFIRTNDDASNEKIVVASTKTPAQTNWKTIIPEDSDNVIRFSQIVGGKLFVGYLKDVSTQVKVFDLAGKYLYDLDLPGIGSVGGLSGDKKDNEAFFTFTSYTYPSTIFSYDVDKNESSVFKTSGVDFDPTKYETKQVFYTSYDGTKIPMFITHKKGIKLDGSNPTLLYGYGGFNISLTPGFATSRGALLETGAVYAVANLRGGGEYGKKWHKAGTKLDKQNVFNDFQAAAEYLIQEKYTSSEKLAIEGRSNGGLLVGACVTQRPDLYAVTFPIVGVMDMLRYHTFTIGRAWATDYGTVNDSPEMFAALRAYSPVHNAKEGTNYPATMVMTADHDDRVVPAHSYKFASAMQKANSGENPMLIRIDVDAGHGAGKSTEQRIQEVADMIAFMLYHTDSQYKLD